MSGLNSFSKTDKILIDTNVLLYVYCPLNSKGCEYFISHYTDTLQKISDSKASVYINALIVSEFINSWLRMDFRRSELNNFKYDYRPSERYKKTLKTILRELKKYYRQFDVQNINDNFSAIDFYSIYTNYPESDFNDIVIAENAITNNCKVLTQDSDFSQYSVTVIS